MRLVVWGLCGGGLGLLACLRARRDVILQRQRGVTFGEANFAHTTFAPLLVSVMCAVVLGLFAKKYVDDVTVLTSAFLLFSGTRLSVIDIDTHTLPRRVLLWSVAVFAPLLFIAAVASKDFVLTGILLGSLIMWCVMKVLEVLSRGDLGPADVTFAAYLGLFLGGLSLELIATALVASFVCGGGVAVVLLLARRAGRTTHLPFGPFLFFGALVAVLR
jgi:leader peptidase (prepilin peptidase)/N-methyltransferase